MIPAFLSLFFVVVAWFNLEYLKDITKPLVLDINRYINRQLSNQPEVVEDVVESVEEKTVVEIIPPVVEEVKEEVITKNPDPVPVKKQEEVKNIVKEEVVVEKVEKIVEEKIVAKAEEKEVVDLGVLERIAQMLEVPENAGADTTEEVVVEELPVEDDATLTVSMKVPDATYDQSVASAVQEPVVAPLSYTFSGPEMKRKDDHLLFKANVQLESGELNAGDQVKWKCEIYNHGTKLKSFYIHHYLADPIYDNATIYQTLYDTVLLEKFDLVFADTAGGDNHGIKCTYYYQTVPWQWTNLYDLRTPEEPVTDPVTDPVWDTGTTTGTTETGTVSDPDPLANTGTTTDTGSTTSTTTGDVGTGN